MELFNLRPAEGSVQSDNFRRGRGSREHDPHRTAAEF